MKLEVYTEFHQISNNESITDSIPIFASQQYADYLNKTNDSEVTWFTVKNIRGIEYLIPLAILKKGTLKKGTFLTATISLGTNNTIELEKEFLNKVIEFIRVNKLCDWIQQCPNWAIFNTYPDGAIHAPFGTYRINLQENTEDELFNNINRKDRQDINKAIRESVVIKSGEECNSDSVNLIQATLDKAKLSSFSFEKFDIINKFFKNNILKYMAYSDNLPQSTCVYFYNSFCTYAMYAGSKNHPERGATSLLHWEAIKESKRRNIKYYDFVGARINPDKNSKQYRIQKFKAHFGPELKEGFLWKMTINKNKYMVFTMYLKIQNLLKGKRDKGDIIDQEIKRFNSNNINA